MIVSSGVSVGYVAILHSDSYVDKIVAPMQFCYITTHYVNIALGSLGFYEKVI
jgi:hypothetical protein